MTLDTWWYLSSAGIGWNSLFSVCNSNLYFDMKINDDFIGNFNSEVLWDFISWSIHGGWVCAYMNWFEFNGIENEMLFDFDANGLYSSVMQDEKIKFPDIWSFSLCSDFELKKINEYLIKSSCFWIQEDLNETVYNLFGKKCEFYIGEFDLFIPEELKFIPIV